MTIMDIKDLKYYHKRMTKVLNELAEVEDGDGADYSEIKTDYRWLIQMLEHRRETIRQKKEV